jgi:trk system potassium uptake protein TrkA
MGVRVAHQLVSPNLLDYIELSKNYTIAELGVPKEWSGKSLSDINPRGRFGCSVVAINKPKGIIIAPVADDILVENDVMVVIGTNQQIEDFQESIGG